MAEGCPPHQGSLWSPWDAPPLPNPSGEGQGRVGPGKGGRGVYSQGATGCCQQAPTESPWDCCLLMWTQNCLGGV